MEAWLKMLASRVDLFQLGREFGFWTQVRLRMPKGYGLEGGNKEGGIRALGWYSRLEGLGTLFKGPGVGSPFQTLGNCAGQPGKELL